MPPRELTYLVNVLSWRKRVDAGEVDPRDCAGDDMLEAARGEMERLGFHPLNANLGLRAHVASDSWGHRDREGHRTDLASGVRAHEGARGLDDHVVERDAAAAEAVGLRDLREHRADGAERGPLELLPAVGEYKCPRVHAAGVCPDPARVVSRAAPPASS